MNYMLFSTPRTPKEYRKVQEPPSPLARFSTSSSPELPSLRLWKQMCTKDFWGDFFDSSSESSSGSNSSSSGSDRGSKSPGSSTSSESPSGIPASTLSQSQKMQGDLGSPLERAGNNMKRRRTRHAVAKTKRTARSKRRKSTKH